MAIRMRRLSTTTPILPTYAPTSITPTSSLFSTGALQSAANVVNSITQNSQGTASAGALSGAASGAAIGSLAGPPVGTVIGAVVGALTGIIPGLGFIATDQAAQNAEDQIGNVINTLYGGTHPQVSGQWADPYLQAAIDTLTYDDFQQNPSHWANFIADEGNIATGQTSSGESSCHISNPGMNCVLWTLLHTKPKAPSLDTATPKRYVAKVNEALTNLNTYLTGLGYQSLSTNASQSTVLSQVANKQLSLSTILGNANKATSQVAQGIGLKTSSLGGTVGTILVLGAGVGIIATLLKQKGGSQRPSQRNK